MNHTNTGTIADIMNKKLLYVREGDRIANVRRQILRFGVTAVPVLDAGHRPVGMVSLRDLARDEAEALESSACPVACAKATDPIRRGAELLAESVYHHLVVVDDDGVAVGIVSSVDCLRALLDLPPRHPAAFEQY
jgi:CBS-domain-containing membrane protein